MHTALKTVTFNNALKVFLRVPGTLSLKTISIGVIQNLEVNINMDNLSSDESRAVEMLKQPVIERTCQGPGCGELFLTRKDRQIYCSYDCYLKASKEKSKAYYAELRKANIKLISKICKACHEEFQTESRRKIYCSQLCYRDACLEKNREFMQRKRAEHKLDFPKTTGCLMCGKDFRYITKRPDYCIDCSPVTRRIKKQWGDVEMPG